MDAYELFTRYKVDGVLPRPDEVYELFIHKKVRTLELVALMYKSQDRKIPMYDVYMFGHAECMNVADIMLTPIVVNNSLFEEMDMKHVDTAYDDDTAYGGGESKGKVLTDEAFDQQLKQIEREIASADTGSPESARTRTPSPETVVSPETVTAAQFRQLSVNEVPVSEATTDIAEPHHEGTRPTRRAWPRKAVPHNEVRCDEFFLYKSKTRIRSMSTILKCRVKMTWVRAVVSRLDTEEKYDESEYLLLRDSEQHVHRTGRFVCEFLRALADPVVKTFSWSLQDEEAIHIPNCRAALQKRCSKNKPEQYLPLAVIVCSIGLPTFQLYTPCSFFKHWHRFKDVTNENIVKALLPVSGGLPGTFQELLSSYVPPDVVDDGEHTPVELFMFKHWYSYPTKGKLRQIVDHANANLERCLGININE